MKHCRRLWISWHLLSFLMATVLTACGIFPLSIIGEVAPLSVEPDSPSGGVSPLPSPEPSPLPSSPILMFGQDRIGAVAPNNTARPGSTTLVSPRQVIRIGTKVFVLDSGNHRVLVFESSLESLPIAVLGQTNLTSALPRATPAGGTSCSSLGLASPREIATDGTRFILSDGANNRVLIWNSVPTSTAALPDVVIGQADFTGCKINRGGASAQANTLSAPRGLLVEGGKLYIADSGNHRILVYNTIPSSNGVAADGVIGQASFTGSQYNKTNTATPSATSLRAPTSIVTDGALFLVSDTGNHRVLVWNTFPTATDIGQPTLLDSPADRVIGQAGFTLAASAASLSGLNSPGGLLLDGGGGLYIADSSNNRVVYHSTIPMINGANALGVFGQSTVTGASANQGGGVTGATLFGPSQLSIENDQLFVSDTINHRILRFDSVPTPTGADGAVFASAVYGQANLTSNNMNQIATPNAEGFYGTDGMCVSGTALIVADNYNHRYLVFDRENPRAGAQFVIGQANFSTGSANRGGGVAANTLSLGVATPMAACAVDSFGRLYLVDYGNQRILVYNSVPTTNGAAADYVIGQLDFTNVTVGVTQKKFNKPSGIFYVNGRLLVADYSNARVLIFDVSGALVNDMAALNVIGQSSFTSNATPLDATGLKLPWSVTSDGTRIFVLDAGNNRVLVYNTLPTSNGAPADFVIGQSGFTSAESATNDKRFLKGVSLGGRGGMTVLDGKLIVPDYESFRYLVFDIESLANDMSASAVIGQANFETGSTQFIYANAEGTVWGNFVSPKAILAEESGDYVWISDSLRVFRVLKSAFWDYVTWAP